MMNDHEPMQKTQHLTNLEPAEEVTESGSPTPPCSAAESRRNSGVWIRRDDVRKVIFLLRAQADDAESKAQQWEKAEGWSDEERERQRSLSIGVAMGLEKAANQIGDVLTRTDYVKSCLPNSILNQPPENNS